MSYWRYEELDNGRSSEHSQYGGRVVSNFYGGRDPRAFQDWLDALEDFFGWIGSSPNRKVHFVKMALKGEAYEWWHSVEEYHHRLRLPPIADWEEMKFKLKEKYGDNCYIQQQRDSALIHALNQVRLCTARLDDGFTRIFSGKAQPSITDLHKPQQTKTQPSLISKPLSKNNRAFSLPIAPPPPIPTNQTNTQTQSEAPSDIPSQPLCANISPKGSDFVTQTQPQNSKFLAHPILSTPKIPQISTTPAPSCPSIQHLSTTHTTGISDTPASTPTTNIVVHAVHHKPPNTPIHPKSTTSVQEHNETEASTQIQKEIPSENPKQPPLIPLPRNPQPPPIPKSIPTVERPTIRTQQTTITLEFLSLPRPTSPPLPPKDPQKGLTWSSGNQPNTLSLTRDFLGVSKNHKKNYDSTDRFLYQPKIVLRPVLRRSAPPTATLSLARPPIHRTMSGCFPSAQYLAFTKRLGCATPAERHGRRIFVPYAWLKKRKKKKIKEEE